LFQAGGGERKGRERSGTVKEKKANGSEVLCPWEWVRWVLGHISFQPPDQEKIQHLLTVSQRSPKTKGCFHVAEVSLCSEMEGICTLASPGRG